MFAHDQFGTRKISPIQFLIILQLKSGPKYGYEMLKPLRDHFKDSWAPKTGTIYPAIRSLEKKGLVEKETREDVDFYKLTKEGNALIDNLVERLEGDMSFSSKYFDFVKKMMPQQLTLKIVQIMKNMSNDNEPNPFLIKFLTDAKMDNATRLEALESLRSIFQKRLKLLEAEIEKIKESD